MSLCALQVIPTASEEQLLLVELVRSVSAMRTETVMQTVKEVLKQPPAIAKDKVSIPERDPFSPLQQSNERTKRQRTLGYSFVELLAQLEFIKYYIFQNILLSSLTYSFVSFHTEASLFGGVHAPVLLCVCPEVSYGFSYIKMY